jgi:hypothetical protein
MKGSRVVAGAAAAVVITGIGVAAIATLWTHSKAEPALPDLLRALPAQTRLVAHLDVVDFRKSPLYDRMRSSFATESLPNSLREALDHSGINLATDIDDLFVAWVPTQDVQASGLALIRGGSSLAGIDAHLNAAATSGKIEKVDVAGISAYRARGELDTLLAPLDDGSWLIGTPEVTQSTLEARSRGGDELSSHVELSAALERVPADGTFWLAGDSSWLDALTGSESALGGLGLQLPPIESIVASAELSPDVALEISATALDEAGARQLADKARGVMALVSLQKYRVPELGDAASAATITTDGRRVQISLRVRYALIDSLLAQLGQSWMGQADAAGKVDKSR